MNEIYDPRPGEDGQGMFPLARSEPHPSTAGLSEEQMEILYGEKMTEKEYRTKSGKVLTDADIQALADEAEEGYDVEQIVARDAKAKSDAYKYCRPAWRYIVRLENKIAALEYRNNKLEAKLKSVEE